MNVNAPVNVNGFSSRCEKTFTGAFTFPFPFPFTGAFTFQGRNQ